MYLLILQHLSHNTYEIKQDSPDAISVCIMMYLVLSVFDTTAVNTPNIPSKSDCTVCLKKDTFSEKVMI